MKEYRVCEQSILDIRSLSGLCTLAGPAPGDRSFPGWVGPIGQASCKGQNLWTQVRTQEKLGQIRIRRTTLAGFSKLLWFFPTLICDWLLPGRRLWSIQPIKRTHAFLALSCDLLQETVQCSMSAISMIKHNRAFVCTVFGDFFLRIWPCLLVCLEGVRSKTKQINECAYPLALLATS